MSTKKNIFEKCLDLCVWMYEKLEELSAAAAWAKRR